MIENSDIDKLPEFLPDITEHELEKFTQYFDILCHFNKRINLVSRGSLRDAAGKHFSDSYLGLQLFERELKPGMNVYDFGSGNGFPGVISAIRYPAVKFILIERDKRKAEFLRFLCGELGISNVGIHAGPMGDLKPQSVEIGMSRAMAPLPKMLLELRTLTRSGSRVFLFKGDTWTTEFGSCPPQLFDLWDVKLRGNYEIPSLSMSRFIIECVRL